MDSNSNRRSGLRRRPRNRRSSNLRSHLLPNPRQHVLETPRRPQLPNSLRPIPNFRALGENWRGQPEIWLHPPVNWPPSSEYWLPSSEFWTPSPSEYWSPRFENWQPNLPSLTQDPRSNGQSLLTVLNHTNNRVENAVPTVAMSASVTDEVQGEYASDQDVVYLYSVDTSAEGHFAEEVDLTVDSEISSTITEPRLPQPASVEPKLRKCKKTKKRKFNDSEIQMEKRQRKNLEQPSCSFCKAYYDELRERNQFLCVARCGHTFCLPCTSVKGARKVCNVCKTLIGSLYKIFL